MFDLEKAIVEWRKGLSKQERFEDGLIADLELHLRDVFEDKKKEGRAEAEAFREAVSQVGAAESIATEYQKNQIYRLDRRSPWRPARFLPAFLGNYLKIAGRRLRRHKAYSFITVAGLAAGLAAFMLIVLYSRFERGYDDFHRFGNRIYRVQNDRIRANGVDRSAACPPALGPAMKKEFPEVEDFVRILNATSDSNIVSRPDRASSKTRISAYEKRIFFVDPSFLRLFSFPLVRGNEAEALNGPEAVVLTESTARKYFGDEDPLHQTLSITTIFGRNDYRVAGICRDIPPNSHLRFDVLLSFKGLEAAWRTLKDQMWSSNGFLTYLLLSPSADPAALEAKFPALIKAYPLETASVSREFRLQPLRSIHLKSRLRWEADVNGDDKSVIFLEIAGLFILIIAWFNFISLTTARSLTRGKEVGIRKTIGAERRQLIGQFLVETAAINILAFLLAVGIVLEILPAFSRLVGKPLSFGQAGFAWSGIVMVFLAGAFISGLFPAFLLSSFRLSAVLRGLTSSGPKGAGLRKGFVLFQFSLAILLIASTLIVGKQLAFVRNRSLGADIDHTLVVRIPQVDDSGSQAIVFREAVSGLASIASATVSSSVPGRNYSDSADGIRRVGAPEDESRNLFIIDVDERYFQSFGIPILAGRAFSPGFSGDENAVLLNEAAAKLLGFESAEKAVLGEIIAFGDPLRVVGVAADYHHKSLREKIEPVIYFALPYSRFPGTTFLSLKIPGAAAGKATTAVEARWKTAFSGLPFEYYFLNDDFRGQYDADEKFGRLFAWASLLAIVISCLGLFGLASYSIERRMREIGVRKVFGASPARLAAKLSGEFVPWILLANLIAWPAVWIVMNRWLARFAYRTRVDVWILGLSAALALAIALATVAAKVAKAASADPVVSLRRE